ncbi:oligopeptide ABC transporter substrate-binding protein OppA [Xenorhabdus nematophila]|uniref:Oligopeptide transport protein (ABC superfamily, peri_bind) n=2 Tax=Xenorhabdus nematophila TaxID=628 RepID=D3VH93_XENNA|nr:ABC transporter substrate-binding protein [Xenorhabdus nematophila]CEE94702.1 oligopeptide transport protein (ABC superfamily, peri_bind) [Xenorhabdus nematophila str. Anatoliense]CEF31729.1 oligopeptide transport protein (ABC superfamily, peri_bind) [Xenorhabdus nematophila str. Websteri]AAR11772.1 OppA1 [Xenorhabdus nematophila]AYA40103.1 oligopeptide ABC transporter substrate-binding protein OppA [Xenorhabdus nematophila]MBA0018753.1 oligopeptide ABC transporter substrate-binding protein
MRKKTSKLGTLISSIVLLSFPVAQGLAAIVPAGVTLAEKQEITINNGVEVTSLDPHKIEGGPETNIIRNLLEGLVTTEPNGEIEPGVAERWEHEGYKVWTFYLREDAKWSDGKPVTAQDFVYSWRRLADPNTGSPYTSYLQYTYVQNADDILKGVKSPDQLGVKALDERRFQVILSQPVPYLVNMLSHTPMKPVRQDAVEKWGNKWTLPENYIGNGAYILKDWVINERLVLTRNSQYWNNKESIIEKGTFLPIVSGISDVNRYRSGEIDITDSAIPPDLYQKMKRDIPEQLQISPFLCTFYYEINNQKPLFKDKRVREAIKLSLDRDIITERIMGQGQIPAYGFTPTYIGDGLSIHPEWADWTQEQRNQRARELLKEAGFDTRNPLKFTLLYNTSEQNKQQAIAAASMWQKNIGAKVTLQNQEWKTSLQNRHEGNYDVARATWCGDYNEPSSFLNMLLSSSSNNTTFYQSEAFDNYLSQALVAKDDITRKTFYQQAESQLDKDSGIIPVYYRVSVRLIRPTVGGMTGKDPLDYVDLKNLYIKKIGG